MWKIFDSFFVRLHMPKWTSIIAFYKHPYRIPNVWNRKVSKQYVRIIIYTQCHECTDEHLFEIPIFRFMNRYNIRFNLYRLLLKNETKISRSIWMYFLWIIMHFSWMFLLKILFIFFSLFFKTAIIIDTLTTQAPKKTEGEDTDSKEKKIQSEQKIFRYSLKKRYHFRRIHQCLHESFNMPKCDRSVFNVSV